MGVITFNESFINIVQKHLNVADEQKPKTIVRSGNNKNKKI